MPEADDLTDEEITDRVASEVAERIRARHPDASPEHLKSLVRAYTRAAVGKNLTLADVGAITSQSSQRVHEIEKAARQRMKHALLSHLQSERGL